MKHNSRVIAYIATGVFSILAILFLFSVTVAQDDPLTEMTNNSGATAQLQDPEEFKAELIRLHNKERIERGIEPLIEYEPLNQSSEEKNQHMAEFDYWDHESPQRVEFYTFIRDKLDYYHNASENLGTGTYDAVVRHNSFMDSPSHKEAIVDIRYDYIGVSVIEATLLDSDHNGYSAVVHFADLY